MFRLHSSIALSALLLIPYASPAQGFQPAQTQQSGSERTLTVPTGATIPIRLNRAIDTKTAKAGDSFQGSIAANVFSGAFVALPIGAPVTGRVVEAKAAGRLSGAAELSLELVSVQLNGQSVAITTRELSSKNNGRGTNTVARTGGGAALGAIIGGIAGGGAGAGIGAASGGALGAGSNIIRPGQQIVLSSEALLQFQNAATLDVTMPTHAGQQIASTHGPSIAPSPEVIDIPNQPDPATFDILTLRLGMTAKEAAATIAARIPGIQPAYPSTTDAQLTPGKKYTSVALYSSARFRALLTFTETYPFDPVRPEQLTSINYQAVAPTEADRQQFRDAILTKYGPPYREVKAVAALWCNKGISLGSGPLACAPDVPNLQLKGTELILSDSGPAHRERAAWNARTTGAPPI